MWLSFRRFKVMILARGLLEIESRAGSHGGLWS